MGANGFTIRYKEPRIRFGNNGKQELKKEQKGQRKERISNTGKPITKAQAEAFKENFTFPAKVCVNYLGSRDAVVSYGNRKTNPTTRVYGSDENFTDLNGYTLSYGRSLNPQDVISARSVCLIEVKLQQSYLEKTCNNLSKKLSM